MQVFRCETKWETNGFVNIVELEFCIGNIVGDFIGKIQKSTQAYKAAKLAGDGRVAS